MFKKVLIPLDGSHFSERALALASLLFSQSPGEALLLTAIEPDSFPIQSRAMLTHDHLLDRVAPHFGQRVVELQEMLKQQGIAAAHRLTTGDPAMRVIEIAEEEHCDLIIMSTHGHTGVARALLGSVADQVLRSTHLPVMFLPERAMASDKKCLEEIVLLLDGSQLAESALPYAQQVATQTKAALTLLRAVPTPNLSERELLFADPSDAVEVQAEMIRLAEWYLRQVQLRLQLAGLSASYRTTLGAAGAAIVNDVKLNHPDLIVMSTHARAGLNRWVYGSVASHLLHESPCPLLIVRGQHPVTVHEPAHVASVQPEFAAK